MYLYGQKGPWFVRFSFSCEPASYENLPWCCIISYIYFFLTNLFCGLSLLISPYLMCVLACSSSGNVLCWFHRPFELHFHFAVYITYWLLIPKCCFFFCCVRMFLVPAGSIFFGSSQLQHSGFVLWHCKHGQAFFVYLTRNKVSTGITSCIIAINRNIVRLNHIISLNQSICSMSFLCWLLLINRMKRLKVHQFFGIIGVNNNHC